MVSEILSIINIKKNISKNDSSVKRSLSEKTISAFLWLGTGSGLQSIMQLLVLAILARLIDPSDFGVLHVTLIVVGFARLMSQMGIGPAIVQKNNLSYNHIYSGFTISLVFGVILALILCLFSNAIEAFFKMHGLGFILKIISTIFIIESFIVIPQSLLQRDLKLKEYATINIISYLFGYGLVGIGLAALGYGVYSLVWALVFQSILKACIATYLVPRFYILTFHYKSLKELLYFGGGVTTAQFANYLAAESDSIITGRYLGAEALGLYSRAYSIMVKPVNLLGSAVDKALFPSMSTIQKDHQRLKSAYLKGIGSLAYI
ncbi:MAG TPA: lipopolysaccharide biosynthesis protein, partial [Tissierellaceae bacterium]|nr:lipopolysaccharide biosynthesis protein [Tissierellaceae bacterium]